MMNINKANWQADVLNFWFEELNQKQWFMSTPELDASIAERFGEIHRQIRELAAIPEPVTPESALAAVIVLDQFSRNMYRGTAEAFRYDVLALSFTKQAINNKLDIDLAPSKRIFLYMPFMHSENLDDQNSAVELLSDKSKKSAVEHQLIIKQFGRFPYRNQVLGRESTAEEIAYLENGKRFGQ